MNKESLDSDLWVDRYGDLLFRYTLVRVNDPDAAQEIVQVTLLAALESDKSFEGSSSEKIWLFGILKHKILDHYRRLKKHKTFDLVPEDDTDPFDYQPDGH
ncbi:MAG: sigma factor [Nitrospinaceae bacterium]|nr:sigma factor [Nitrospinaceae bacterium]